MMYLCVYTASNTHAVQIFLITFHKALYVQNVVFFIHSSGQKLERIRLVAYCWTSLYPGSQDCTITCPWGTLHFWRQVTSWHSVIKPNPGSNSNLRLYTSAIYVMHGHTWFGLRHIPPRVIIKLCQSEFNRWISLLSINYKISPTTWKILSGNQ